jgi:molybdate transport system substrate-binding protein
MSRPTRRSIFFLLFIAALLAGCGGSERQASTPGRREVLVAAASSLREAFTEIARELETVDSTVKITFNFGASNLLARQIERGAPDDLFASAAEEVIDSLQSKGVIDAGSRVDFARNRLVVVGMIGSSDTLSDLSQRSFAKFQRIAVGAPGVPVRIYTEEALRNGGIWEGIEPKLVYGENVRQVLDYVARGEAPIGFVYASDVVPFRGKVRIIHTVDSSLHRPIAYPAAIVTNGSNHDGAGAFIRMLTGKKGEEILRKYGFER